MLLHLRLFSSLVFGVCLTAASFSQQPPQPDAKLVREANQLAATKQVRSAFARVDQDKDAILKEWISLTEINAPSGQEAERAKYIQNALSQEKFVEVRVDHTGNVVATRKGTGGAASVVFDAHMDTVFKPGLQIKVRMENGRIYAPGVGDDTRNVEAMLEMIRALNAANIRTRGDLIFVFTTQEETGLDGAKNFIAENSSRIGSYVALDGGYEGFTYSGIGINWYRHHFIGPGGHTRSKTPPYSATLPLARAITRIYELPVPEDSNLNIGMLGGSEVENAKAADAWFSLDLRSTDQTVINDLEKRIALILQEEAAREHMAAKTEVLSLLPASQRPENRNSKLIRTAEAVHLALGFADPPITATASNNANQALLAGLPAMSTGTAPCQDSHALTENCEIEPFYKGIKKVLLLAVAMAELAR